MDAIDRRRMEVILREQLTRQRLFLATRVREAQHPEEPKPFTLDNLVSFYASFSAAARAETLNALAAVRSGQALAAPQLDTPEKQLVWGAALTYLSLNPDVIKDWAPAQKQTQAQSAPMTLSQTQLWAQVTGTNAVKQELLSHAHHVREALRDRDTKYAWNEPGTGFTYNRRTNVINIDLMQTLVLGFEHARADVFREIGHALLSVSYTSRMQELYKQMVPLLRRQRQAAAKKGPKLSQEEYKQLRMMSAEWELRHMMFGAAEENVANRFVANMGQQMLQDYSVSLNNTAVTSRHIGLTRVPPGTGVSDELRRYMNLCNAVQLSFFQNNKLFDDTDHGWRSVGVEPGLVRKTATLQQQPAGVKDDGAGIAHPDFQHLRQLCGGPKGLENLQPRHSERLYGWASLKGRVIQLDAKRKEIIEEILQLYGEDLIQKILLQINDSVDQQLKEAKQKQQQNQEQDGEEQDQDQDQDQDGQEQDGSGQGNGKPQKGKKGKKGKRGQQQGEPQDMDDLEDQEDGEQDQDQNQDGQEQDSDKQNSGDKGEKQDQENQKDGAGDLGTEEEETVPVDGAGDMPQSKDSQEIPSDEVDPSAGQDAEDADGQDAEEDAKSMEELEKEAEEGEEAEGEADADADADKDADADADADGAKGKKQGSKKGKGGNKAGHGDGKSLNDLAKQDWADYEKRVSELSGHIEIVRRAFKEVQKRQLQRKTVQSKSMDILPENGELKERFNIEAHRDLTIKKKLGGVEEKDLKRFHKDEDKMTPTEIDIVIMIDGSGSMDTGRSSSNATPLECALQASAILYEAASGKDMKMNVYVGMWGNSEPPVLIRPGDDRVKIGKAMEAMRRGLNSGTDFAPAVSKVAETIGEQRGRAGTLSGFTHVLVLSDGDISDVSKSSEKMQTMFQYCDRVTFDAAIIKTNGGRDTNMQDMAKNIKGRKAYHEMGAIEEKDPNKVPMAVVGLLLDKIRKCGSFIAVPNSKKRRDMKNAHNKMDKKK